MVSFFLLAGKKKKRKRRRSMRLGGLLFPFSFFLFFFLPGDGEKKKRSTRKTIRMEEKIKHDTKIKATWRERECPVSVGLSGQGDLQPPPTPHLCSFYDPGREGKGAGVGGAWAWKDSPPKWALGRPLYGWQAPCTPGSYKATGSGGQSECESR